MNSKYKQLLSDTLLFTISNFSSKIISFFLIPLYTNVLSTTDYGISDLLQTTVNFLYPMLTLSISEATIRFALDKKNSENKKNVLGVSLFFIVSSVVLLIIATPIISSINKQLYQYWGYFLLYYLFFNVNYCFGQYARGTKKMRIFALQGIINTIVVVVSNIFLLVIFRVGVKGYILSFVFGYIVTSLYMFVKGKYWRELFPFEIDKTLAYEMLKYSLPMIPTQVFWWVNNAADKWIIINKIGLSENGLYSVAHKLPTVLTMLTGLFNQAWQVSAVSNYGEKDNSSFFSNVYSMFVYINISVCTLLITLSQLLGRFLFSEEFYRAWRYVPFLLLAAAFNGISGMLASAFTSTKKTVGLFVSTGIGAVINIALNFLFVNWFGGIGAAYATALGCMSVFLVRLVHTNMYIRINANYIVQAISIIILFVQAYLTSNNIFNIWIVGIGTFLIVTLLNKKYFFSIKNSIIVLLNNLKVKIINKGDKI